MRFAVRSRTAERETAESKPRSRNSVRNSRCSPEREGGIVEKKRRGPTSPSGQGLIHLCRIPDLCPEILSQAEFQSSLKRNSSTSEGGDPPSFTSQASAARTAGSSSSVLGSQRHSEPSVSLSAFGVEESEECLVDHFAAPSERRIRRSITSWKERPKGMKGCVRELRQTR